MSTAWNYNSKPDLFGDPSLQIILTSLRTKNEEGKIQAAKSLQSYVMTQSRDMSTENFKRWMNALLKTHIWNLITSQATSERVGGLIAVDELIDVAFEEGEATSILANYIHVGLKTGEPPVMILAAKALGHLSRDQSTITIGLVEFEMKSALEWLQGERQESKRYAACLVLKELAKNAPTLFYAYVATFVDLIWVALRDSKQSIRESAVDALGASLELIAKRDSKFRQQWYPKIYEESLKGFSKQNTTDSIHGSLLTIGQLVSHSGDFLKDKFNDVCQTVLKYKDHKVVKHTVIELLPRLAEFSPEIFVNNYLNECITFLISTLSKGQERSTCFLAIGQISIVVSDHIRPYLDSIVGLIKSNLTIKTKTFVCSEALICASMLAKAVGGTLQTYTMELLDQMFAGGLTTILTTSLSDLAQYLPDLAVDIRCRLLDVLSLILQQKLFNYSDTPNRSRKKPYQLQMPQLNLMSKEEIDKVIALALNILGSFNFEGFLLTEFLRESVVKYLYDANPIIRKEAAICCCNLMSSNKLQNNQSGYYGEVISEVLAKLLSVVVADNDSSIRLIVLEYMDSHFDSHLAQASNLAILFTALNDEVFDIREKSLNILCRLAPCNPAYVLPALRTSLIHLLTELEYSGDNKTKEESSKLLVHLIRNCGNLVKPYAKQIMNILLPKLKDEDPCVSSGVLATVGELSTVHSQEVSIYMDDLLPIILETLQDQSSSSKREVGLHTLAQITSSTANVIGPYIKYPKLLDTIINLIQSERSASIRKEVISVFGILGALDPYKHRLNQLILEGRTEDEEGTGRSQKSSDNKENQELATNLSPSSEDYYPTITIQALMRILKDSSLSIHHTTVIHVLMSIVKSLGIKSIQFLPQIMPPFLQVMKSCEPELRTIMFQQLGLLVARVKQHIRDYLPDMFQLIHEYWHTPNLLHIITLIEEISLALSDEFKPHLLTILPKLLSVLSNDASSNRNATSKILHSFEIFGTTLDDYLHLVIPVILKVLEQPDCPLKLQIECLLTLSILCRKFNVTYYASRILHPLSRILDNNNQDLQKEAMKILCILVKQLGTDYIIYSSNMDKLIQKYHIVNSEYDTLVNRLRENLPFVEYENNSSYSLELETPSKSNDNNIDDLPPIVLDAGGARKREKLNEQNLKRAWEVSQRSTKEDWIDWLRKLSVELLRESPSPALRSCISLATDYHPIVKELFNAAFISCWSELTEQYQDELVRNLESALSSPTIPPEILQTLLNLAEFMEQDEKPLPIDPRTLGEHAENCHAYAKALHYKEMEFRTFPQTTIEALISIYNQLQQPDAALGILIYAKKHFDIHLKESWYEKLQNWKPALLAYERRGLEDPLNFEITLGKMRCLNALGEWDRVAKLSQDIWNSSQLNAKRAIAPLAASAAWNLSNWQAMKTYSEVLDKNTLEHGFFKAILAIHSNQFDKAHYFIDMTRSLVDTDVTALLGESYNRAYKLIVKVQQLAELEEVIKFKEDEEKRNVILKIWNERLIGAERNVETWQSILAVRSLVLSPIDDLHSWLKFCSLCRKSGRLELAQKTLVRLLGTDPNIVSNNNNNNNNNNINNNNHNSITLPVDHPRVTFAYIKHIWASDNQELAFNQLKSFVPLVREDNLLQARIYLKLGEWHSALQNFDENNIPHIISAYQASVKYDTNWYKSWHAWALANYEAAGFYEKSGYPQQKIMTFVVPAIKGFFRSIALASNLSLQDTLRILTLWFKHGANKDVEAALVEGFQTVTVDNWLQVIPQIIARIHAPVAPVRRMINELLTSIGKAHPQALVYSLSVASKSQASARSTSALGIMDKLRKHCATLVEQAQLVSNELVRVSILWHEMWHEGLEEASRTYFADHNTEAMLATLRPLHEMLEKGPETIKEISFQQAYGRDLQEAYEWCKKWERSKRSADLSQAWDLYYKVFRRINKQLPQMTNLELQHMSPKLLNARELELAVPGTYRVNYPIICIKSFAPALTVITSKQRPRKLIINGSDGAEYMFLLKGHEDLRQDERVMQLFGLVNTILKSEYETSKDHLSIQRYSVIPLSPNSGLIGWVPHCDTLHHLIRDYRDSRKILINIEHRLMLQMAPDYDNLSLMQKVEAFEYALESTNGQDLERILWLKSSNSEVWLDRRTNYTRSLAVMSMVGYILGLGDRHPSNLMLDRHTGKILHIDFGDCFEVAMHREKYPEKIPFRLTRMLINAMEVSGIEGTFRFTCENVMRVLRENKDSLIAVLEAFVYDPIINWRLLTTSPDLTNRTRDRENSIDLSHSHSYIAENVLPSAEAMPEILNKRALQVIKRVSNKLTGRDFGNETLNIPEQVQRLIGQATSHENLCQCYIGWCPFW